MPTRKNYIKRSKRTKRRGTTKRRGSTKRRRGGAKSKGISMKDMRKSMADMFGEEAMKPNSKQLPHRSVKSKAIGIRSAAATATEKKKLAKSVKKALEGEVDDLSAAFGNWKM